MWTWRQKCKYMLTLLPKGAQTKVLKFFRLKIFSICHRCRWHRWCTLSCEYLREFLKKFEMAEEVYSDAWGNLIHEKNQKSKISWHCPFKVLWPADCSNARWPSGVSSKMTWRSAEGSWWPWRIEAPSLQRHGHGQQYHQLPPLAAQWWSSSWRRL